MSEMKTDSIAQLFMTVLQHMKCIEVRMDYAKVNTMQKQKMVLANSIQKVRVAINDICSLLPDSDKVIQIKKELDKSNLVYVMVFTEQLMRAKEEDLEVLASMIENYLDEKYQNK
jgi:hypothetical protein